MKKLTILLLCLLTISFVLAACTQTETTNAIPRWDEDEEWIFDISKAVIPSTDFQLDNESYMRVPVLSSVETNPTSMDQLVPEDICGTYKMTIHLNEDHFTCTFTTEQEVYAQYIASQVEGFGIWNDLAPFVVDATDPSNPFENHTDTVTLRSTTTTAVVFNNDAAQRPISSETHLNGFYLGKKGQEISKFDIATSYNWEKSEATVVVNGQSATHKLKAAAGKFIDMNQTLLYLRSLEKTQGKFADSPRVQVYQPQSNTISVMSFSFSYEAKTVLHENERECPVKVNLVGVLVDGAVLLIQQNVPDYANAVKAVDTLPNAGGRHTNRYTTLSFRSGIFNYELRTSAKKLEILEVLEGLTVKKAG